jgi:hypothetical protein
MTNARRSGSFAQSPPLSCISACMGKHFIFSKKNTIPRDSPCERQRSALGRRHTSRTLRRIVMRYFKSRSSLRAALCLVCTHTASAEPHLLIERKAARATPERCRHVCAFLARLVQLDRKLLAVKTGLCRATWRRRNQFSKGRAAPRSWRMGNLTRHTKCLAL